MSPAIIFQLQLALGYIPWLLLLGAYVFPKLRSIDRFEAQRVIAIVHSFRFFGLAFIMPGVVGPNLPAGFATLAAYGDFATGVLAMLALLSVRVRTLFWLLVGLFNVVGVVDLVAGYVDGIRFDLPHLAGDLGATYAIPVIYVPLLMITHVVAFMLMFRRRDPQMATR